MPTFDEIVQAVLGRPPDQPRTGFVVDRVARQAKLQADALVIDDPGPHDVPRPPQGRLSR